MKIQRNAVDLNLSLWLCRFSKIYFWLFHNWQTTTHTQWLAVPCSFHHFMTSIIAILLNLSSPSSFLIFVCWFTSPFITPPPLSLPLCVRVSFHIYLRFQIALTTLSQPQLRFQRSNSGFIATPNREKPPYQSFWRYLWIFVLLLF